MFARHNSWGPILEAKALFWRQFWRQSAFSSTAVRPETLNISARPFVVDDCQPTFSTASCPHDRSLTGTGGQTQAILNVKLRITKFALDLSRLSFSWNILRSTIFLRNKDKEISD